MLAAGRFSEFVDSFIKQYKEDELERVRWEYWLHRDFEHSYSEYKQSLGMKHSSAAPTRDEQIKTVRRSREILNGFCVAKAGAYGDIQDSGDDSG